MFITRDLAQQMGERRETVCLVKMEARQRYTSGDVLMWAPPLVRRSTVSSWLSHLYGSVLPSLCSASAKYPVSFSTPDLSWDPSPGCTCIPQPRQILKWMLLGRSRCLMAWHYPLTFHLQGAFLYMRSAFPVLKGRIRDPLILYQTAFCSSLSLPWTITLRCL